MWGAPIVLDLALFGDLARRVGMYGIQEWLSFYFKSPMHAPGLTAENDLFIPRGSSERKEGDAIDTPLKLWDLEFDSSDWGGEGGRTVFIKNRDTHTFGIGVTVPKNAEPCKYTVTIYVDYEVSGEFTENSKYTQERPVKLFVTVP